MVPPGPEARKRLRAPRTCICNTDLIFSSNRTAGWIEVPLRKNFRRPQILCLEISGSKVVLLCKFSLYRAVWAPVGARTLRLHQPHGWPGPDGQHQIIPFGDKVMKKLSRVVTRDTWSWTRELLITSPLSNPLHRHTTWKRVTVMENWRLQTRPLRKSSALMEFAKNTICSLSTDEVRIFVYGPSILHIFHQCSSNSWVLPVPENFLNRYVNILLVTGLAFSALTLLVGR